MVGMVGPKSIQTKVVGITMDKMHPYTFVTDLKNPAYWS